MTKNVAAKLQYDFCYDDASSSGGANNYLAHAVFATLVMRLPWRFGPHHHHQPLPTTQPVPRKMSDCGPTEDMLTRLRHLGTNLDFAPPT